jgi:hypothetical protein
LRALRFLFLFFILEKPKSHNKNYNLKCPLVNHSGGERNWNPIGNFRTIQVWENSSENGGGRREVRMGEIN